MKRFRKVELGFGDDAEEFIFDEKRKNTLHPIVMIDELILLLNNLNEELYMWKGNYGSVLSENSILENEISICMEQGYKPSSAYRKYRGEKVVVEDIIGLVKTDEPTNSVVLKKQLYNDTVPVVEDKMISISEGLLEDIRHELATLNGLQATDKPLIKDEDLILLKKDEIWELDYTDILAKIDKIL